MIRNSNNSLLEDCDIIYPHLQPVNCYKTEHLRKSDIHEIS